MLALKIVVGTAVVWWLFVRKKPSDPHGNVSLDDDGAVVTFIAGNGNWSDVYKTHATEGYE